MLDLNTFKNMSLTKKISLVLFIIFLVSLAYCLFNRKNLIKTQVDKENNIRESFKDNDAVFTMYFVEWCPHCVSTKPHFKELMKLDNTKIGGKNVRINMVDCEKEPEKAEAAGVESYPSIKLENNGEVHDYEGERTKSGFISWLKGILS